MSDPSECATGHVYFKQAHGLERAGTDAMDRATRSCKKLAVSNSNRVVGLGSGSLSPIYPQVCSAPVPEACRDANYGAIVLTHEPF